MARALGAVWPLVKGCLAGGVVGITVADWWASIVTMDGASLHPAFDSQQAARALVEKRCLYRYDFSRGDVVVLRSPRDHRELVVKRLIALPGDWIQIPEKQEIRQIPQGHCWVEGDNATLSFDSRSYGPGSIRLVTGHKFLWVCCGAGSHTQSGHPTGLAELTEKCPKEGLCHCDIWLGWLSCILFHWRARITL